MKKIVTMFKNKKFLILLFIILLVIIGIIYIIFNYEKNMIDDDDTYRVIYNPNGGYLLDSTTSDIDISNIITSNTNFEKNGEVWSNKETGFNYNGASSGIRFPIELKSNGYISFDWAVSSNNKNDELQIYIEDENINYNLSGGTNYANEKDIIYQNKKIRLSKGTHSIYFGYLNDYDELHDDGIDKTFIKNFKKIEEKKVEGITKSDTFIHNKKYKLKKNEFIKDNYSFIGWSKNKNATTAEYKDEAKVNDISNVHNGEIVLYAVWK